jgi:hypothetical protein
MDSVKYIGMDVHKETISIAVRNSSGKLVMEYVIETKTTTILQFFQGIHGTARHCTPPLEHSDACGKIWRSL